MVEGSIVRDVLFETKGLVLWLDSATIIKGNIDEILYNLKTFGTYIPIGCGSKLSECTYYKVIEYYGIKKRMFMISLLKLLALCGINIIFGFVRDLISDWRKIFTN